MRTEWKNSTYTDMDNTPFYFIQHTLYEKWGISQVWTASISYCALISLKMNRLSWIWRTAIWAFSTGSVPWTEQNGIYITSPPPPPPPLQFHTNVLSRTIDEMLPHNSHIQVFAVAPDICQTKNKKRAIPKVKCTICFHPVISSKWAITFGIWCVQKWLPDSVVKMMLKLLLLVSLCATSSWAQQR
jgi:hypothetical protein